MKRLFSLLLVAVLLAVCFTGCKKEEKEASKYVEGGMKIVTTTADFSSYTYDLKTILDYLHESGFRYADLSLYSTAELDPFMDDDWQEYAKEIKDYAASKGITFVQSHAIGGNALKDEASFESMVKKTIRCIEVCQFLEIPITVVHPGHGSKLDKEAYFEKNKEFYEALLPTAQQAGVTLMIENSSQTMQGHYCMQTGEEMREFLEYVNHPNLKACWDTGHAHIEGNQYDHIVDLGEYVVAIHISDNLGEEDNHMMPYQGTVNFDEVMCALKRINYSGHFTFECTDNLIYGGSWLNGRDTYPDSLKVYAPPVEIKIETEITMRHIGEHILEAYEIPIG